jgi:hypothetical protein
VQSDPQTWPSYFQTNLVRLDELDGVLVPDLPPPLREDGAAWVLLRRYIPGGVERVFAADERDNERTLTYAQQPDPVTGIMRMVADLDETYIERRDAIAYRRAAAYIQSWSYDLPVNEESLRDMVPWSHGNAILSALVQLRRPRTEEETKSLLLDRAERAQVRGAGKNGRTAVSGGVHPHEGVREPAPPLPG